MRSVGNRADLDSVVKPTGKSLRLTHRLFSKRLKPRSHFIVRELAALRLLQYPHRLGYSNVPLVYADFLPVLFLLQAVIGPVIFYTGRAAVFLALCLLAVSAYLPAGPVRFSGGDVVAVDSVVARVQQKVGPAVVAAAGCIACGQSPAYAGPKLHLDRW